MSLTSTNEQQVESQAEDRFKPQSWVNNQWRRFLVPAVEICTFLFALALVPSIGYSLLLAGVGDKMMVTFVGGVVIVSYIVLSKWLEWRQTVEVKHLNGYFESVLHAANHDVLKTSLEVLLEKLQPFAHMYLDKITYTRENWLYNRYMNLVEIHKLTMQALDYSRTHRGDDETLEKMKLSMHNLETQVRSIGWGEGANSVAARLYAVRYHYWDSFKSGLREWFLIAWVMVPMIWLYEANKVVNGGQSAKEIYGRGTYGSALGLSWLFSFLFRRAA